MTLMIIWFQSRNESTWNKHQDIGPSFDIFCYAWHLEQKSFIFWVWVPFSWDAHRRKGYKKKQLVNHEKIMDLMAKIEPDGLGSSPEIIGSRAVHQLRSTIRSCSLFLLDSKWLCFSHSSGLWKWNKNSPKKNRQIKMTDLNKKNAACSCFCSSKGKTV